MKVQMGDGEKSGIVCEAGREVGSEEVEAESVGQG